LLILINKQDLTEENPITVQEAVEQYDLSNLIGRIFNIIPSSAKYGYELIFCTIFSYYVSGRIQTLKQMFEHTDII